MVHQYCHMGHTVVFCFLGKHESLYCVPLLRNYLFLNTTTNPTPTNYMLEFSTFPAQEVCPVREELARNHDALDTRLFVERFVAKTDRAEDVGPQLPVFYVCDALDIFPGTAKVWSSCRKRWKTCASLSAGTPKAVLQRWRERFSRYVLGCMNACMIVGMYICLYVLRMQIYYKYVLCTCIMYASCMYVCA